MVAEVSGGGRSPGRSVRGAPVGAATGVAATVPAPVAGGLGSGGPGTEGNGWVEAPGDSSAGSSTGGFGGQTCSSGNVRIGPGVHWPPPLGGCRR